MYSNWSKFLNLMVKDPFFFSLLNKIFVLRPILLDNSFSISKYLWSSDVFSNFLGFLSSFSTSLTDKPFLIIFLANSNELSLFIMALAWPTEIFPSTIKVLISSGSESNLKKLVM
mgnify:CR=1 FL=1